MLKNDLSMRQKLLKQWAESIWATQEFIWEPLAGDASFRRYYRCRLGALSWIVVDSPPDSQNNHSFAQITHFLRNQNILVPEIQSMDVGQGFFILTDFGNEVYFNLLSPQTADFLYPKALDVLLDLQSKLVTDNALFPFFDRNKMHQEWRLFVDWFLIQELQIDLTVADHQRLNALFEEMVVQVKKQPTVLIHRDYHSRNLMWLPRQQVVGILDYQDANLGPITYDVVSLLRDCYLHWDIQKVHGWAHYYFEGARQRSLISNSVDFQTFLEWFDWMGIQRHLKAVGIFARLHHRDHKSGYLKDIPRTLRYIQTVKAHSDGLFRFQMWLQDKMANTTYG